MSARDASSALILSLLIGPAFLSPAFAGPWLPAPGEYYTELRGGLFSANTYRNDAGDHVPLGGEWEERSLFATVELGWKKNMSIVMAAPFISATRMDAVGSTTSTGLEDMLLGVRLGIHQGRSALAAELNFRAPLGYDRTSSLFANSLHGGANEHLSLSFLYGTPMTKRGFLQIGAGLDHSFLSLNAKKAQGVLEFPLNHAPEDLDIWYFNYDLPDRQQPEGVTKWSNDVKTSADAGIWVSKSLFLCGRWIGMFNLNHGYLLPAQNTQLLGPVLLWRVDERLDLSAGSWTTAVGKNTLHYDQVYVALTFKQTRLNRLQGFLGGTKAP